jgi:lipoprotein-releasing system permease protein
VIISRIAVVSISIGLAAMILCFFILGGFQATIKKKIYDFKGHLEVTKYSFGNTFEDQPINKNGDFYQNKDSFDFISHVQEFAHKAALLKTKEEVQGVLLKGVGMSFDQDRFNSNIIEGRFIQIQDSGYSKEIVISKKIATSLRLKVDDDVLIYFVQNPPRFRKLHITGIYETGLEEIDQRIIIGDIGLVQRINNWGDSLVSGFEVFIKNPADIDAVEEELFRRVDVELYVDKVNDKYLQLFDWLGLLNQNVIMLLSIIQVIAVFNMISILLILIMERTNMIGILQALGASRKMIKRIFIYNGMLLIAKGLFWGNIIALALAFIQDKFKIIPLDSENYYMHYVPIYWDYTALIGLNVLTFIIVSLALGIPTLVISRIKPIAAMRFD